MYASRVIKLAIGPPSAQTYMALGEEKAINNKEYRQWRHHRRRHRRCHKEGRADIGPTEPPKYGASCTKGTWAIPPPNVGKGVGEKGEGAW